MYASEDTLDWQPVLHVGKDGNVSMRQRWRLRGGGGCVGCLQAVDSVVLYKAMHACVFCWIPSMPLLAAKVDDFKSSRYNALFNRRSEAAQPNMKRPAQRKTAQSVVSSAAGYARPPSIKLGWRGDTRGVFRAKPGPAILCVLMPGAELPSSIENVQ